ncbi:MAG: DNA repair protein RadA [Gammaproteobacteria bacterium]|nr:DNA repair protein RadA [Gammaproteobacteria bacterium]MCH9744575.1 DNA repair protein RadA [Gammaproteobacteria bacterium]
MVVKSKVIYSCQNCGTQHTKWQGQCTGCKEWNTIVEEVEVKATSKNPRQQGFAAEQSSLTSLDHINLENQTRLSTGLTEFDHVLGGGLVSDSAILIGGDPGIGKSTLLLQVLCHLAERHSTLYVTGEESLQQIALRAKRLGLSQDNVSLLAETNVERILTLASKHQPSVMVIDSIQTIYTELVQSAPGGVSQLRESTAQLVRFAKQKGIALIVIGHVTKEGAIAGPRVLEHMVDAVLYFEGQSDSQYRMIRAVKNRFGGVNELGVFAMTDRGLKQVSNPSAIFLSRFQQQAAGSSIMVTWEGSRPLLVEIQALVDESHLANPRRVTVGLDHNRLAMLLAVLHRHGGVATYDQDVFVNAVGGLRIAETAADLAVVLSILSSLRDSVLPADTVVFGELGLTGEIRPVPNGQLRIKEAAKHHFKCAIVPEANMPKQMPDDIEVIGVATIDQLLAQVLVNR